jgi:hypothetical protein
MIREQIKVEDFEQVAKENEFFLWNFVVYKKYYLDIRPIFEPNPSYEFPNALVSILSFVDVPYFETEIKDAYDFLINLDNGFIKNVFANNEFQPHLLSFNRRRMVGNTLKPKCYCSQGVIELIGELNPQFLLDSKI